MQLSYTEASHLFAAFADLLLSTGHAPGCTHLVEREDGKPRIVRACTCERACHLALYRKLRNRDRAELSACQCSWVASPHGFAITPPRYPALCIHCGKTIAPTIDELKAIATEPPVFSQPLYLATRERFGYSTVGLFEVDPLPRRVLFLDIDGVLNSVEYLMSDRGAERGLSRNVDMRAIERVNRIIRYTGCDVVVSSTFRFSPELPHIMNDKGLCVPIAGITPTLEGAAVARNKPRGLEIQAWMDDHRIEPENILILDDDADMAHLLPRLIQTSFEKGLTDEHVAAACALIGPRVDGLPVEGVLDEE